MSKVRLKQLAQDGASPDEVIKWNDTSGAWEPGTGAGGAATDLATSGSDVAIDSTAPAGSGYILKTTSATVATWQLGGGDVSGPASNTANAITSYSGTGGKTLQDTSDLLLASGDLQLESATASVRLAERATGPTNVAAKGHVWVKNTTPSSPWFTADDGAVSPMNILAGTTAAKPAAASSSGQFYFSTDDFTYERSNGTAWEDVGLAVDDTTLEATTDLHIKDNGVTLAKMAGGTDGNLITYDAAGDPAYVTTGTAGQVLTSAGAGAAPSFQARDLHVRSLTLEDPTNSEDFSIFWTKVAITVTRVAYAVRGATPSITCTVNSNTSRSGTGTVVHTITTGTSTAGTDAAPSGTAAVAAGGYVWLETTAVGAATDELFIAIEYTED